MSTSLYKTNPSFIFNYKRAGYKPPPIKTFESNRSSRFFYGYVMDLLPPFGVEYFVVYRFFNYQIHFPVLTNRESYFLAVLNIIFSIWLGHHVYAFYMYFSHL